MDEDVDLLTPAMRAVIGALLPIADLPDAPAGLQVFDHVPQDTPAPFIKLGTIKSVDASTRDEQMSRIEIEVICQWVGNQRDEIIWMVGRVRKALNGRPIAAPGAVFSRPVIGEEIVSEAIADGVTYVALSTFSFNVQPA
ncbi:tail completion protein gp17 [Novosphingobium humi]|uniref:DUF3168 domain-containing protein n=1 Tax=Novosphingobium humi TaxID=2282397 RepID=A0ABY7U2R8_9SPHN|nr:DUF3168 domain-containing protein [Novosphingobium humi]WCT78880.1 DUF3168 domain-containing protein [Novosphingobium humi]